MDLPKLKYIYLLSGKFDCNQRKLIFEFTDDPVSQLLVETLEFSNISKLSYESLEVEDDCLDSLVGITVGDSNEYIIHTEKNEYIFHANGFLIIEGCSV